MNGRCRLLHVDGLRGVAIIFVLLFHACAGEFPNGFLGVDVFFVISGYFLFLNKDFIDGSVWKNSCVFLRKKVTRLMLPVSVLVLFTCILGVFFVLPNEFVTSVYTGLCALLGVSNMYLGNASQDYFSPDNAYNPLVHTWYISVLVQVYMLYLLGNIVLQRAPRSVRLGVLAIIFAISFFCSKYVLIARISNILPDRFYLPFDYYSTTTRLWEVLAGGAVAFISGESGNKWKARFQGIVSFLCLVAIVVFALWRIFPNLAPVIVVLSSMFCIAWGGIGLCGRVLGSKPVVYLGRISFSLYLVHMPVLALYRSAPDCSRIVGLAVMLLIFLLGILYYVWVESRKMPLWQTTACWISALACGGASLWYGRCEFVWRDYYPHYASCDTWKKCSDASYWKGLDVEEFSPYSGTAWMSRSKEWARENRNLPMASETLLEVGLSGRASFLLIGDSYASMLYFALNNLCKEEGLSGLYLQTYIVPYYGWIWQEYYGSKRCESLVAWLEQHPEIRHVILAQNWFSRVAEELRYFNPEEGVGYGPEKGFEIFLQKLCEVGCRVIVTDQLPFVRNHTESYNLQCSKFKDWYSDREEYVSRAESANSMLQRMEEKGLCEVWNVSDALYSDGVWRASENGEYLMFDGGHLSPLGAERVLRRTKSRLLDFFKSPSYRENTFGER